MEKIYEVFLSHNSRDKDAVVLIAQRLRSAGLNPFLDKWHLIPGEPWQEALEEALDASETVAVFIGPHEISPWLNEEMRDALNTRTKDKSYRVIPVMLPGAALPDRGKLPRFLARLTWVDFRGGLEDEEAFHRLLSGIRGQAPGVGETAAQIGDEPPYRGLEKFRAQDAPWFFGRESETQQIVEKFKDEKFLAVMGASGSGKSSVVLAGLVPEIYDGKLPGSQDWPVVIMSPTEKPLEELAVQLAPLIPEYGPTALLKELEVDRRALYLNVREALREAPKNEKCVLVVDQFEEVFTLCNNEGERQGFLDQLLYAASVEAGSLKIILTMRADFMGKCVLYPELADQIARSQFIITPMDENQLRGVITHPAERAGLSLETGLADHILKDVLNQPGGLPLLEHALLELWNYREGNALTYEAYRKIGGVSGAVARTADQVFESFSPDERVISKRIFLSLVQPGEGTEDTRRRARLSNLVARDSEKGTVESLLQSMADRRLVTTDQVGEEPNVNLSHEALIQNWPRLRGWIDENRESLRIRRHLADAAQGWDNRGRDADELYRGARLAQAVEWASEHEMEMSALDREFLRASQEALDRERRNTRLRWVGIAGVLAIALVLITLAVTGQLNRYIYRPLPMEAVEIPEGDFMMGSPADDELAYDDEFPQHPVTLGVYHIGRYEVTNRQYAQCVKAGVCSRPSSRMDDPERRDHPVVDASWYDAQTFCAWQWRGGRLPTEAEWEKAARGGLEGASYPYPWGDEDPACDRGAKNGAQFADCGGETVPVGSFSPNGYGLYDIAGNVWEWTSSLWDEYPYDPDDGRESRDSLESRVLRGGSWYSGYDFLRVAVRSHLFPDLRDSGNGFRCARSP